MFPKVKKNQVLRESFRFRPGRIDDIVRRGSARLALRVRPHLPE
jgi:hypothetical protein